MGYAPMELKLKRKKDHIIRIEKQGYNSFEIRITRKNSVALSILGNLFWGALVGGNLAIVLSGGKNELSLEEGIGRSLAGTFLGCVAFIWLDASTGANHNLSPDNLFVTLTKIEGKPQSNFILVDTEKLQHIKWIRIKCAEPTD
jgi:hypothetical protein